MASFSVIRTRRGQRSFSTQVAAEAAGGGGTINITGASNPATADLEMSGFNINNVGVVGGRNIGNDGTSQDAIQALLGVAAGSTQLPILTGTPNIPAGDLATMMQALKTELDTAGGADFNIVDAAGDILVGTADNTVGRLALGAAGQVLQVNAGGTSLEYAAPGTGVTNFLALNDTPGAYTGLANRILNVNAAGNAVEFGREVGLAANNLVEFDANRFLVIPDVGNNGQFWFVGEDGGQNLVFRYGTTFGASSVRFMMPVGLGASGQVLQVNAGATGTEWAAPGSGVTNWLALNDTPNAFTGAALNLVRVNALANALEFVNVNPLDANLIDAAGDLLVGTADNVVGRLAIGTAGQQLRVNGAGTALEWAASASSPLTTKGDLYSHDGTNDIRFPVGTNDQAIVADSTTASGLAYSTRVLTAADATARDALVNVRPGQIVDVADDDGNGLREVYVILTGAATFAAAGKRKIGPVPTFDAGGAETIPAASAASPNYVRLINHASEPDQTLIKLGDNSAYALTAASGGAAEMTGATAGSAGTAGSVPAPAAGDQAKFFRGDGTYADAVQALAATGAGFGVMSDGADSDVRIRPARYANFSIPVGFDGKIRVKLPHDATLTNTFDLVDSGSFDYDVDINGAPVTGLTGISVSLTAETPRSATAANTGTAGQIATITISNNASAVNGFISARFVQTGLYV